MNAHDMRTALELLGWARPGGNYEARNVLIRCPFAYRLHKSRTDNEPSMAVAPTDTGTSPAICNSCGTKGSFVHIVRMAYDAGLVTNEVFLKVASFEIGSSTAQKAPKTREGVPKTPEWKAALTRIDSTRVSKLVLERGFTRATCLRWELGFDPLLQRTVFPVYSREVVRPGMSIRLVGLLSRRGEQKAKVRYPTYKGWDPSLYLYGEHLAPDRPGRPLAVVEGPLDALWVDQHSDYPVVALMGLHLSKERILKLRQITECLNQPLLLFLDNDKAGMAARERFTWKLKGKITRGVWTVEYPKKGPGAKAKDPPELNPRLLSDVLESRRWIC